jgi:hypothetical protein
VRDVTRRRLLGAAITLGLALGAPALGVVAGTAPLACAATNQRAALVVDTGADARSYCVALGADTVSGTDLIRLAHDQYGLDYRLGYGGNAVCRLANVGVDDGDCFAAYPDFWGYWHGDGDGGWTWASSGAADWTVEAGDVEGWQWGPGQDGTTHAAPPATREADVCPPASPSPDPSPDPSHGGGGGGNGGGSAGRPSASPSVTASPSAGERPHDHAGDGRGPEATPRASPTATGAPTVVLASGQDPAPPGGGGGAAGPLVAAAAVLVLGAAGAVLNRRRRAR